MLDRVWADAFFSATGMACPGSNAKGRYKLTDGSLAPEMVYRPMPQGAAPAGEVPVDTGTPPVPPAPVAQ